MSKLLTFVDASDALEFNCCRSLECFRRLNPALDRLQLCGVDCPLSCTPTERFSTTFLPSFCCCTSPAPIAALYSPELQIPTVVISVFSEFAMFTSSGLNSEAFFVQNNNKNVIKIATSLKM